MGKGTGEARPGTLEMVILPPVETIDRTTDESINALISEVRQSIAKQLNS
jgi:hypothetical protein